MLIGIVYMNYNVPNSSTRNETKGNKFSLVSNEKNLEFRWRFLMSVPHNLSIFVHPHVPMGAVADAYRSSGWCQLGECLRGCVCRASSSFVSLCFLSKLSGFQKQEHVVAKQRCDHSAQSIMTKYIGRRFIRYFIWFRNRVLLDVTYSLLLISIN